MTTRTIAVTFFAVVACGVCAQYALDNSLNRQTGKRNAPKPKMQMAASIYTVNRQTGELVYNRANAFQDQAYNSYQRYTIDRERYFDPMSARLNQSNTSAAIMQQRQQGPSATAGRGMQQSLKSPAPTAGAMRANPYQTAGSAVNRGGANYGAVPVARPNNAMRAPTYRPTSNRAPY